MITDQIGKLRLDSQKKYRSRRRGCKGQWSREEGLCEVVTPKLVLGSLNLRILCAWESAISLLNETGLELPLKPIVLSPLLL